tara:strand:+ start:33153 stop:33344 length:192 start_codon:yes stop_codon:yes gene_type:complete
MNTKSSSSGSHPDAVVVNAKSIPEEEYQTFRGCLMLFLILLAISIIAALVMVFLHDPGAATTV